MRDQLNKGNHLLTPLKQKKKSFFQGGERKRMKMKKFMASFLAFAMLLSLVAIPAGTADAATTYSAVSVPALSKSNNADLGQIKISADPLTTTSSAIFTLPSGAKINTVRVTPLDVNATSATVTTGNISLGSIGADDNEFRLQIVHGTPGKAEFVVDINADISSLPNGEVAVGISHLAGQLPNGSVVVATIGSGSVGVTAGTIDYVVGTGNMTVGSEQNVVTITLTEKQAGAMKREDGTVRFTLPDGFTWAANPTVTALVSNTNGTATSNARELVLDLTSVTDTTAKEVFRVEAAITVDDLKARYGDVNVTVRGTSNLDVTRLTVAKFADFGVTVDVKDATNFIAGQGEQEIGTIIIEETAPSSLVENRTIYLKLPAGVKWIPSNLETVFAGANFAGTKGLQLHDLVDATGVAAALVETGANVNRTVRLTVAQASSGGADKLELKDLKVETGVGFSGPIEVEVSGNAGVSGKVTVATVDAPVTVTVEKVDVEIGTRSQKIGKITIKENFAGALMASSAGKDFDIVFDNKMTGIFTNKGTLNVIGDSDIDASINIGDHDGGTDNKLYVRVKRESLEPATLEITGVEITLDRTVPYGDFMVNIGAGSALKDTEQSFSAAMSRIDQVALATVVTPVNQTAPEAAVSQFVIDSKTYTVNGVEKPMDVAPFIQDGRTMLPVKFAAEAVGVSEDNIIWNANTKQVTIMKGDRIAQMQIGSDVMLVNGISVQMDTVAAIKDERTVLPLRFVAQALGATIEWDDATRTATVK